MSWRVFIPIFTAVLIALGPTAIFGQETKPKNDLSVKQQAMLLTRDLKRNLRREKNPSARNIKIIKFKEELSLLRSKNAVQAAADENYLNSVANENKFL
jgi:hypothetical protein